MAAVAGFTDHETRAPPVKSTPKMDDGFLKPRTAVTASVTTMTATARVANRRELAMNGMFTPGFTACIIFGFHCVCSESALWKTMRVKKSAVNIEATMPATSVTAKPRMRPVPKTNRTTPVRMVVMLPSKMAENARW